MSYWVTIAVAVAAIIAALLFIIDIVRGERRRGVICLVLLAVFLIALNRMTGFPVPEGRIAFGGTISIWWAVVTMSIGIIFGMIAQYVWSKPEKFLWLDFLRPIVISPLVLLPLVGSLSGALEPMQLLSLTLLAFQNGYFWQKVLADAQPKLKP